MSNQNLKNIIDKTMSIITDENKTYIWDKLSKLKDKTFIEYYENKQIRKSENGEILIQYIKTTVGRVLLNDTIQKTLNLTN